MGGEECMYPSGRRWGWLRLGPPDCRVCRGQPSTCWYHQCSGRWVPTLHSRRDPLRFHRRTTSWTRWGLGTRVLRHLFPASVFRTCWSRARSWTATTRPETDQMSSSTLDFFLKETNNYSTYTQIAVNFQIIQVFSTTSSGPLNRT